MQPKHWVEAVQRDHVACPHYNYATFPHNHTCREIQVSSERAADPLAPSCRRSRAGVLGNQVQVARPGDGLGPVSRAKLRQNVADVLFDGVEDDHELAGDALIRPANGE